MILQERDIVTYPFNQLYSAVKASWIQFSGIIKLGYLIRVFIDIIIRLVRMKRRLFED